MCTLAGLCVPLAMYSKVFLDCKCLKFIINVAYRGDTEGKASLSSIIEVHQTFFFFFFFHQTFRPYLPFRGWIAPAALLESRFKGEDSKKAGLQLRRLFQKSQVELGSTQAWVFLVQD